MQTLLIPLSVLSFLVSTPLAFAETVNEAIERFLGGEVFTEKDLHSISDIQNSGPRVDGNRNNGSKFLHLMKCSIINPIEDGDWWFRSDFIFEERAQATTYRELKAIYEKDKSPIVAYALVCPAMYVNDFELLPELIAKIGENKHLKAHFDKVYASYWKPRLDPDF